MRRVVLTLAALTAVALTTGTTLAGHGYGGYAGGYYGARTYRPYQGRSSWEYGGVNSHAAAVKRITAAHSRYRYNPHPRSFYKSPPHRYDFWGW